MHAEPLTGRGAGVYKYDVLTALAVWAMQGSATEQMAVLRLIALVTARYNWQRDELCIGQRDIARLWGVTDRTVKREIKRLTALGLLAVIRPGVRGRVASYRLVRDRIAVLTAPHWDRVGPDFVDRFAARRAPSVQAAGASVLHVDFARLREAPEPGQAPWDRVLSRLRAAAPDAYGAWFARLALISAAEGRVTVGAPSAFVQSYVETHYADLLSVAVRHEFGAEMRVVLGPTSGSGT